MSHMPEPAGTWHTIWHGPPQKVPIYCRNVEGPFTDPSQHCEFAPPVCSTPWPVDEVRLELDTCNSGTEIEYHNIDAVELVGSPNKVALPLGIIHAYELCYSSCTNIQDCNHSLLKMLHPLYLCDKDATVLAAPWNLTFLPAPHWHGIATFNFSLSDCLGDKQRTLPPTMVRINTIAVPDAPSVLTINHTVTAHQEGSAIELHMSDLDTNTTVLFAVLHTPPLQGELYRVWLA